MILLAPMEGLLDHSLRDVLTQLPGADGRPGAGLTRCVSEFIRVTDQLLPPRVFLRVMPELRQGSRTSAGVPVRAQLLGSDPACLADNAAQLAALGAEGIDLNFGCPAKTVNRHRGGAVLLDEPELLHAIVQAVRAAVPAQLPVSAKMRLGNADHGRMLESAQALADGGAQELVVHGRTKLQGYRPPAYWDRIGRIRQQLPIPVIANGEIWSLADALRCRAESGCQALMLGRGLVADPGLALALHAHDAGGTAAALPWSALQPLLQRYWQAIEARVAPRHRAGRLKQWLNMLRRRHPQAQALYERVREVTEPQRITALLGTGEAGTPVGVAARVAGAEAVGSVAPLG